MQPNAELEVHKTVLIEKENLLLEKENLILDHDFFSLTESAFD